MVNTLLLFLCICCELLLHTLRVLYFPPPSTFCSFPLFLLSLSLPSIQSASLFEFCLSILWMSLPFQLHKMKQLRAVYPEKTVYTQQVGPGCCFGALALMLRFYFEVTIILKLILSPNITTYQRIICPIFSLCLQFQFQLQFQMSV